VSHVRYLAAGVWGVTYSRCIADHGCDDLPRVILKLAGLPADTAWKDARTDKLYSLSSASLAAGFDLGVESYMNEAVRMLITNGVTPHLIMGYVLLCFFCTSVHGLLHRLQSPSTTTMCHARTHTPRMAHSCTLVM
jgi:hypothetical protein